MPVAPPVITTVFIVKFAFCDYSYLDIAKVQLVFNNNIHYLCVVIDYIYICRKRW